MDRRNRWLASYIKWSWVYNLVETDKDWTYKQIKSATNDVTSVSVSGPHQVEGQLGLLRLVGILLQLMADTLENVKWASEIYLFNYFG